MQAEFFSELGHIWLDVPVIEVAYLPPRDFPPVPTASRAERRAALKN